MIVSPVKIFVNVTLTLTADLPWTSLILPLIDAVAAVEKTKNLYSSTSPFNAEPIGCGLPVKLVSVERRKRKYVVGREFGKPVKVNTRVVVPPLGILRVTRSPDSKTPSTYLIQPARQRRTLSGSVSYLHAHTILVSGGCNGDIARTGTYLSARSIISRQTAYAVVVAGVRIVGIRSCAGKPSPLPSIVAPRRRSISTP